MDVRKVRFLTVGFVQWPWDAHTVVVIYQAKVEFPFFSYSIQILLTESLLQSERRLYSLGRPHLSAGFTRSY